MKNLFMLFMIVLMALPAALPWMPHGAAHALHDQHISHHQASHQDDSHQQLASSHEHHAVAVDIVTYFSDYLHVDLQQPDQAAFVVPSQDAQDMHFDIAHAVLLPQRFELAVVQNRAPPAWLTVSSNYPPLYLSTQRLRI